MTSPIAARLRAWRDGRAAGELDARGVRLVLAGFLLAATSSFGQTFFIALFGGEMRAAFGLSHGELGAIYSAATLASGLSMIWIGAALDRMALARYAILAGLTLVGGAVLFATAWGPAALGLAILGLRLGGQGMMSHATVAGMARAFTRRRGTAIALANLGHPAGEAVLPITAVALAAAVGWRATWGLAVLAALAATALVLVLLARVDDRPRRAAAAVAGDPAARSGAGRREVLRDPRFWLILPALLGPSYVVTGLFFHQVPLVAAKGWPLALFAGGIAVYAAASSVATLVSGAAVDRLGARRPMRLYLAPLALGCLVLGTGDDPGVALAFLALAGATGGTTSTITTSLFAETYGLAHIGAIRAMVVAFMVVSSALAPGSMGWLLDLGVGIDALALGSAVYLAIALALVWLALALPRPAAA